MLTRTYTYNAERSTLHFRVDGEIGPIELVIGAEFAWVAFPPPPGEDDPECEITLGLGVAALWRAADQDDEVVWAQLEQLYAKQQAEPVEVDLSGHPAGPELVLVSRVGEMEPLTFEVTHQTARHDDPKRVVRKHGDCTRAHAMAHPRSNPS